MTENQDSDFMMESYRDSSQNVMHIEGQLFNHMTFFLTLFIGVLTATIAAIQLTREPNQAITMTETIGVLSLPFLFLWFVGQFEIQMIMQLRVRKMKFIEAITKAREYFIKSAPELSGYIILPAKLEKAPPYLRISSDDWYKLLFVLFLNTVSLFFFWMGVPPLFGFPAEGYFLLLWMVSGLLLCFFFYTLSSYKYIMDYFSLYDRKREIVLGKPSEYDLLEIPLTKSWPKWSLSDWFVFFERQRNRNKNDKTN